MRREGLKGWFEGNSELTYPCSPSSWTRSHKFKISSQFSLVRFSSVVLTVDADLSIVSVPHPQLASSRPKSVRTDNLVIWIRLASSEHGDRNAFHLRVGRQQVICGQSRMKGRENSPWVVVTVDASGRGGEQGSGLADLSIHTLTLRADHALDPLPLLFLYLYQFLPRIYTNSSNGKRFLFHPHFTAFAIINFIYLSFPQYRETSDFLKSLRKARRASVMAHAPTVLKMATMSSWATGPEQSLDQDM